MGNFLTRWIVTAIAASFAIYFIPGITIPDAENTWVGIIIFSLFLAIIDVSLKPLLQVLTFLITVMSLGIFALIVNTGLFYLAAWCCTALFNIPVVISSFGSALMASLLISIITAVVSTRVD